MRQAIAATSVAATSSGACLFAFYTAIELEIARSSVWGAAISVPGVSVGYFVDNWGCFFFGKFSVGFSSATD